MATEISNLHRRSLKTNESEQDGRQSEPAPAIILMKLEFFKSVAAAATTCGRSTGHLNASARLVRNVPSLMCSKWVYFAIFGKQDRMKTIRIAQCLAWLNLLYFGFLTFSAGIQGFRSGLGLSPLLLQLWLSCHVAGLMGVHAPAAPQRQDGMNSNSEKKTKKTLIETCLFSTPI
ncbi:MAG: hypothetical protein ABIQ95_09250 [Bdellovibrionia bacterium]